MKKMIILMAMASVFAFAQNQGETKVDVQIDEKDGAKIISVTVEADSTIGAENGKLEIIKKVIVIGDDEIVFPEDADVQHILDSLGVDLNIEMIEAQVGDAEKKYETILIQMEDMKNNKSKLFTFDEDGVLRWGHEVEAEKDYYKKTPFMGVTSSNLTFQEAYEMHYPHNFGVEITSVIKGTNADRAGLMNGDIVMKFDGIKVRGESHLTALIRSKHIGDTVEIVYFRSEEINSINLTFLPKYKYDEDGAKIDDYEDHKSGKLSPGYGGGGLYVKFVDFDYSGINAFITQFGFSAIAPERTVYFGGGGMGNIGKGWFLGGNGFGFLHSENITISDSSKRHLTVENGFGGVTLTKKIPLFTKRLVFDLGLMLGGGMMTVEIGESNGFSWGSSEGEIYGLHQKFHKNYFAGEATVGLMWRVKNWFGFRGQFGKMKIFTLNDIWTENTFPTDLYSVSGDAPEIPSGLTYTAGIWFGF